MHCDEAKLRGRERSEVQLRNEELRNEEIKLSAKLSFP